MYEAESRTSRPKQEGSTGPALPPTATLAEDEKKTKKQLIDELLRLRERIRAEGDRHGAEGHTAPPTISPRRQPRDYLHHQGIRRLRVHLRKRESPRDHGLHAAGDDDRPEGLARPSPS